MPSNVPPATRVPSGLQVIMLLIDAVTDSLSQRSPRVAISNTRIPREIVPLASHLPSGLHDTLLKMIFSSRGSRNICVHSPDIAFHTLIMSLPSVLANKSPSGLHTTDRATPVCP